MAGSRTGNTKRPNPWPTPPATATTAMTATVPARRPPDREAGAVSSPTAGDGTAGRHGGAGCAAPPVRSGGRAQQRWRTTKDTSMDQPSPCWSVIAIE